MVYGYNIIASPDSLRSISSTTFTGAYQAVGAALSRPIRIVKFLNDSSVGVTLSWDGTNDHDYLPAGSFILYDLTSNETQFPGFFIPVGTQFYVKGAAGVRSFYISCIG